MRLKKKNNIVGDRIQTWDLHYIKILANSFTNYAKEAVDLVGSCSKI